MRNIEPDDRLTALRDQLSRLGAFRRASAPHPHPPSPAFPERWTRGVLHDLYAATPADAVAVNAFGLGAGLQAADGGIVVWGLHEMMGWEAGRPHGPGLHEMGLAPSDVLLVRAPDIQTLLIIGEEALRTPAVGAVLLSAWGEAKALSLTASRRLALAAETGGGTLFLARAGAAPAPSAAETRWAVQAAASTPLEGGAPGRPSFSATLLRRRGGGEQRTWTLEWDRDDRSFCEPTPLSGAVVPMAAQRSAEAWDEHGRCVA